MANIQAIVEWVRLGVSKLYRLLRERLGEGLLEKALLYCVFGWGVVLVTLPFFVLVNSSVVNRVVLYSFVANAVGMGVALVVYMLREAADSWHSFFVSDGGAETTDRQKQGWRAWAPRQTAGLWICGLYFLLAPLIGGLLAVWAGLAVTIFSMFWYAFEFGKEQERKRRQQSRKLQEKTVESGSEEPPKA